VLIVWAVELALCILALDGTEGVSPLEEDCTLRDSICEGWLEVPKIAVAVDLLERLDSIEWTRLDCSGETEADENKLANEARMLDSAGLVDNLDSKERIRLVCSGETKADDNELTAEVMMLDLAGDTEVTGMTLDGLGGVSPVCMPSVGGALLTKLLGPVEELFITPVGACGDALEEDLCVETKLCMEVSGNDALVASD